MDIRGSFRSRMRFIGGRGLRMSRRKTRRKRAWLRPYARKSRRGCSELARLFCANGWRGCGKKKKSGRCAWRGGLFLNPLLVAAIEARAGFEKVFVQPAAGNEGTALGAAWLVWHQQLGRSRMEAMAGPYWGPAYSNADIKKVLENCKAAYHWCDSDERKLGEAVRLLQAGKIVAWFQGAAEFGPRGL